MKKQLLSGIFTICSYFAVNAQNTCATAVAVSPGLTTVSTINGTVGAGCYAQNGTFAEWYSYTPTENGVATVTTNLAANVAPYSTDTRLSVFTGSCAALTCYAFSDDVSATNYRSEASFNVLAGTTYYIAFDNRWSALGFQFQLSFTPVSCFPVETYSYVTLPTTSLVTISWTAPVGPTPGSYDVEYGTAGFVQGTGTTETVTTTQIDFDVVAGTNYEFYIRSQCGDNNYSDWTGPIAFNSEPTPVSLPYTQNFDSATNPYDGFGSLDGWFLSTGAGNAAYAQSGTNFYFSNISATETVDEWLFVRPVTLSANERVTFRFYSRYIGNATDNIVLNLNVGTDNTNASQNLIQSFTYTGSSTTYTQHTATWTPPADGTYYFSIQHASPAGSGAFSLLLDSVNITSAPLSIDSAVLDKFSVFPNPANNVVNVSSTAALVTGVQIADVNGRVVKAAKFEGVNEAKVSISDISSGVYMMTILSDKGSAVKKIIKN